MDLVSSLSTHFTVVLFRMLFNIIENIIIDLHIPNVLFWNMRKRKISYQAKSNIPRSNCCWFLPCWSLYLAELLKVDIVTPKVFKILKSITARYAFYTQPVGGRLCFRVYMSTLALPATVPIDWHLAEALRANRRIIYWKGREVFNKSPAVAFSDPPTNSCPRLARPWPIVDWRGGWNSNRSPAITFIETPTGTGITCITSSVIVTHRASGQQEFAAWQWTQTGRRTDTDWTQIIHTLTQVCFGYRRRSSKQTQVSVSGLRSVCVHSAFCEFLLRVCPMFTLRTSTLTQSEIGVHSVSTGRSRRVHPASTLRSRCVRFDFLESKRR